MGAIAIKTNTKEYERDSIKTKKPFASIKIVLSKLCQKLKTPSAKTKDLDFERYARLEAKRSMYTMRRDLF